MSVFVLDFVELRSFGFLFSNLGFGFVMSKKDSVSQPPDWFPTDDCSGGFGFGVEDEDFIIDIESIYRILNEEPDSMEVWFR